MVKVGDKIEVMVDNLAGAQEKKGAILTVTRAPGYDSTDPLRFTTSTNSTVKGWYFDISDLSNGNLKLLTSSVPANVTNPIQFKVWDLTEWSNGSQYLIIGEKGLDFTIQLVKVGSIGGSYFGIGHIYDHPKAKFYHGVKLVPQNGVTANWFAAYQANPPDKTIDSLVAEGLAIGLKKCECGADKHGFASHSTWCDCYEPTWRNV